MSYKNNKKLAGVTASDLEKIETAGFLGALEQLDNVEFTVTGADVASIATALKALLNDMIAKGHMAE